MSTAIDSERRRNLSAFTGATAPEFRAKHRIQVIVDGKLERLCSNDNLMLAIKHGHDLIEHQGKENVEIRLGDHVFRDADIRIEYADLCRNGKSSCESCERKRRKGKVA